MIAHDPAIQDMNGALACFEGHVRIIGLPDVDEARGRLIEFDYASMSFEPRRVFLIDRVPKGTVRGGHAHRSCEQLLVCLQGSVTVDVALKGRRAEISLDDPRRALYLNAGVWARQRYEHDDTRLLVFASLPFDPDSYVIEPHPE